VSLFTTPGDVTSALSVKQQANCNYQRTAVCGFERFAVEMANGLNVTNRVYWYCMLADSKQGQRYSLLQFFKLLTS
jgi:hypothetical protein